MLPAVRCHHVMTGLGSAVVAYHQAGLRLSGKGIGHQTLAGVTKPQIYKDERAQGRLSSQEHFSQRGQGLYDVRLPFRRHARFCELGDCFLHAGDFAFMEQHGSGSHVTNIP